MSVRGNRYLAGEPILPYQNVTIYPNTDVFFDFSFVDHTMAPVIPTSISIEIDNITAASVLVGPTLLNAAGNVGNGTVANPFTYPAFASSMYLQVAGILFNLFASATFPFNNSIGSGYPYAGTNKLQVSMVFTATDTITGQPFTTTTIIAILELVNLSTASGAYP
jgi:hypothetical protein